MTLFRRTELSDGRQLLFFEDSGSSPTEIRPDSRPTADRPRGGALRFDMLTGEWVAVATHRQSRTHLPDAADCPLCPSTPERPTEIPASDFDVVVFENRFPSLGPALGTIPSDPGEAFAEAVAAPADAQSHLAAPNVGRCEVVVFTADHHDSFAGLDSRRVRTVIDAWAQRTAELSALPGIEQVFVFENRGEDIGVTMHHPHGQIYAYPYVTARAARTTARAARYQQATGRPLMGDLLAAEQAAGERMVLTSEHFSAFVPFAARWPIEVHLVPHRQVATLADLTEAERADLAEVYPELLRRLDGLYSTPTPYIAAWHQVPVGCEDAGAQWMHLEITSPRRAEHKLKFLAGSEAAMGAFVSDVSAEETAARLRALKEESR
ncbi:MULTISPECIES: galactose-1-phosphate uridylyltransferase [Brevibacterium]|uniref:Galactose-1-phosphate uridylyltransferase n=1 Tax=Brevibacterium casei TaxID=33889 RepID=A0AB34XZ00_9MICO|nr:MULTISPECIES: galactose-1-phosphate uridylyltransferase [Brevibacterium]KZE22886.1 galactose-1-phosphate uridylyltransferase [Brevibacterium casei]MCM1012033.1 galactose-1-phosphate uridylyltransferase [Brevibacterium sp. XM4083]